MNKKQFRRKKFSLSFCITLNVSSISMTKHAKMIVDMSTVPELSFHYSKRYSNTKTHYSKCAAPLQQPFLLAGELASPAAEV